MAGGQQVARMDSEMPMPMQMQKRMPLLLMTREEEAKLFWTEEDLKGAQMGSTLSFLTSMRAESMMS